MFMVGFILYSLIFFNGNYSKLTERAHKIKCNSDLTKQDTKKHLLVFFFIYVKIIECNTIVVPLSISSY